MQFTVLNTEAIAPAVLPTTLNNIPALVSDPTKKRTLVLIEVMGPDGPVEILLNGQKWGAPISEFPVVGSTEDWEIVTLKKFVFLRYLHLFLVQI
jgi:spore coat protein A, manganese oxidase